MCGRYFQESFRIASRIGVGALGQQLVGAVNFALGQSAVEWQTEKLPATFFRRQDFQRRRSPAELRRGERRYHLTNDGDAPARQSGLERAERALVVAELEAHVRR